MAGTFTVVMRRSEKRPLFAQLTPASGNFTISGTPTFAVYQNNAAIDGASGNVTGYDTSAASPARAWVDFQPIAYNLAAGTYRLTFSIPGASSDGLPRIYKNSICLVVRRD